MGLPVFSSPAEGVLPLLVMNTATSVAAFKKMLRSVLQVGGASANQDFIEDEDRIEHADSLRARRVSIIRYDSLCRNRCKAGLDRTWDSSGNDGNMCPSMGCCVCLSKFKANEEVSVLSCKHFFHKACLEKWLDNQHTTCPLCRSTM